MPQGEVSRERGRIWCSGLGGCVGRHRVSYEALGPRPKAYFAGGLRPLESTWKLFLKFDYTELVGIRVRRLRRARGWTQAETVRRVERPRGGQYTPGLLSRVENGYANPPLYVYVHLAEAFGIDPGRLMGSEESQKPISEAEMTAIRFLRATGIAPHDAMARLAGHGSS
jgi:transcriptional regulator with XRE-family HTH domain